MAKAKKTAPKKAAPAKKSVAPKKSPRKMGASGGKGG